MTWDDATWILTSSFIIFTMQSGFGLLESGAVSHKNEVNIMVKNTMDVLFGGITYWLFGYGISFGEAPGSNPFMGVGYWAVDVPDAEMGVVYSSYIFQLSFATTATTIVSGAMAERTRLTAYILFSFLNTIVYSFPAHWIWGRNGFLNTLGAIDIAGSGVVHLCGAVTGLVAAILLKPRSGRYDDGPNELPLGNPTNAIVGMFMLWWGWLGFNCGSTFGISGGKWKLAAKSAATTINASIGGGIAAVIFSYIKNKRKYGVSDLVNGILGSLVSITASCAVVRPWEALVIGALGGVITIATVSLMDRIKIDDPVSTFAIHGSAAVWGLLAVGLFVEIDYLEDMTKGHAGLFKGGGMYLLGVQSLAVICIIVWSAALSVLMLYAIHKTIGLRMTPEEEMLGADLVEHNIGNWNDPVVFMRSISARPSFPSATRRSAVFPLPPEVSVVSLASALEREPKRDNDPREQAAITSK
ncbi:putative ammonium transporter 3 [Lingula anatina]|uniref:Ammonium transporter n=1 Tax=Lingula anatina TaxID=7574 RepID=A0A1S3IHP3_LINAN|nr:putative ammonium transporter 3 [Lingula anatina]|eukprot:XP_013397780.1 putative ammonium transporter 3 [Lingula anatina]